MKQHDQTLQHIEEGEPPAVTPIRISAKNIGSLSMPDVCERCWWLKQRCGWKTPYSIFPGIFAALDSHVKRIIGLHFAVHGALPHWLPPNLGTPLPSVHWSKFSAVHAPSAIRLVGSPDEMTRRPDKSISILDYKTARHTNDNLLPIYETQLNCYAWLAEQLGVGEVSELFLIYCEPQGADVTADPMALVRTEGFAMNFAVSVVPVRVRVASIPLLLIRAREIADLKQPPSGRSGCKDCQLLNNMLRAMGGNCHAES